LSIPSLLKEGTPPAIKTFHYCSHGDAVLMDSESGDIRGGEDIHGIANAEGARRDDAGHLPQATTSLRFAFALIALKCYR